MRNTCKIDYVQDDTVWLNSSKTRTLIEVQIKKKNSGNYRHIRMF